MMRWIGRADCARPAPEPAPWLRRWAQRAAAALGTWRARRAMRAELREDIARIDERVLRDIGVTRHDLIREAYRPFWRP